MKEKISEMVIEMLNGHTVIAKVWSDDPRHRWEIWRDGVLLTMGRGEETFADAMMEMPDVVNCVLAIPDEDMDSLENKQ
jgi:hypothetical protein